MADAGERTLAEPARTMTSGADSGSAERVVGSAAFTTAYLAALLPLTLGLDLVLRSSAQLSQGRITVGLALALLAVGLLAFCGWKLVTSFRGLSRATHRNE